MYGSQSNQALLSYIYLLFCFLFKIPKCLPFFIFFTHLILLNGSFWHTLLCDKIHLFGKMKFNYIKLYKFMPFFFLHMVLVRFEGIRHSGSIVVYMNILFSTGGGALTASFLCNCVAPEAGVSFSTSSAFSPEVFRRLFSCIISSKLFIRTFCTGAAFLRRTWQKGGVTTG